MAKSENNVVVTFWLVQKESDHSTIEQMRAAGEAQVYEPRFASGQRHMLSMLARFDPDDERAKQAAAVYAARNTRAIMLEKYSTATLHGVEITINGERYE
jgi:hypothetical protein